MILWLGCSLANELVAPPLDGSTRAAIAAFARGDANASQQRAAFRWIVMNACGVLTPSYVQGDPHHTSFLQGAQFVGIVLMDATGISLRQLTEDKHDNGRSNADGQDGTEIKRRGGGGRKSGAGQAGSESGAGGRRGQS